MKTLSIAIIATVTLAVGNLDAQIYGGGTTQITPAPYTIGATTTPQYNPYAQPAQHQTFGPPQTYPVDRHHHNTFGPPQQQTYPIQNQHHPTFGPPQTYPTQVPFYALPQHPQIVTANQVTGWNPYTGGPNTKNTQVENTYFDPTRNLMRRNGTERFVRRPVYNNRGQIVGYEQGHTWQNTITGAEHHELKTITDNGKGGTHEQERIGF